MIRYLCLWLVSIELYKNKAGCIFVGMLFHYLILVAWAAEGLLLFQKIVILFVKVSLKYFITVSVICWGEMQTVYNIIYTQTNTGTK